MRGKGLFLIGRAPGRQSNHDPERHALFPYPVGCTGHRLYRMSGLTYKIDYILIPRRNVIPHWPGKSGAGDAFPMREARQHAERLRPLLDGHSVLFVGKGPAKAFGHEADWLEWQEGQGYDWGIIPHPSGRNRWYNEPGNKAAAERFLQTAVLHHLELQPGVRHSVGRRG